MVQKDVLTDRKMTCKNVLEKLVQVQQEDNSAYKTIFILCVDLDSFDLIKKKTLITIATMP